MDDSFDRRAGLDLRVTELFLGTDLMEYTAAAIMELDLSINVDTSCVHLAGALGLPLWILVPATPDWRWML